jgi:hypothetical protein
MIRNPLILIAITILLFGSIAAQERSAIKPCRSIGPERQVNSSESDLPFCSPSEPLGYEINRVYVSDAAERAKNIDGSYVIVIARLGRSELPRHNRARLQEIKTYLEEVLQAKTVIAEGESVRGFGRLEIYVAGKLLYVLPVRRTATLGLLTVA